jgi:hypothetical protein
LARNVKAVSIGPRTWLKRIKPIMMGCGPPVGEDTARRGSKPKAEKRALLWMKMANVMNMNKRLS